MASDLFNLVADSTKADLKLRLYQIERLPGCGNPLIVNAISLGQVPVRVPDRYVYTFDEIKKDTVGQRSIMLDLYQRVWFWDVFAFNKKFEEKAGKVLLGSYADQGL